MKSRFEMHLDHELNDRHHGWKAEGVLLGAALPRPFVSPLGLPDSTNNKLLELRLSSLPTDRLNVELMSSAYVSGAGTVHTGMTISKL